MIESLLHYIQAVESLITDVELAEIDRAKQAFFFGCAIMYMVVFQSSLWNL